MVGSPDPIQWLPKRPLAFLDWLIISRSTFDMIEWLLEHPLALLIVLIGAVVGVIFWWARPITWRDAEGRDELDPRFRGRWRI